VASIEEGYKIIPKKEEGMMQKKRVCLWYLCLFLFCLTVVVENAAYATNGYFTNGTSIESKALGGAGVALPQGALDAAINPALMAFVGNRLDLSLSFFNPERKYTVEGNPSGFPGALGLAPGTFKSSMRWFLIPSAGVNWKLSDSDSVGISMFANGGMNTSYHTSTFYGSAPTGVDLMQLFISPTYARKIAPNHAIGISPILAYQRFEAIGLQAFSPFSVDPVDLTNKGHSNSYGIGGRIGYMGEIFPFLNIGAEYKTKIIMSRFGRYEGLFAENGSFDIPPSWTVGITIKPIEDLAILADVEEIYYNTVKSINNPLLPNLQKSKLGTGNGAGFGWDDITVVKLGVQWKSSKEWTWRAGYSIGDQPIPRSEVLFNILAPGVIKEHLTFGATRSFGNSELKLAVMRAFNHSVEGPNALEAPGQQKIRLTMGQWEVSVGYGWKF
jgi:long-chain fatty acid transport protein